MGEIRWDFPLLGTGKEQGYTNSGIEHFRGNPLENLAREICQNSLDAGDASVGEAVKVKFELKYVDKSKYVMFTDYMECISDCKANWGARMDDSLRGFIGSAENVLSKEQIPILIASDYNTTGLTGVKAGEDEPSVWKALAHSDGICVKGSDDSAGSFGIGKNAPFACSELSMVFYNTYATDGGRAFQGTSRLASLKRSGKKTCGTGHYLYLENEDSWRPISNSDSCSFHKEFSRDAYGTDIIIVGFTENNDWINSMIRAIVSNFFLAIYEEKLVVDIKGHIIDSSSLPNIVETYKDEKLVATRLIYAWYQALTSPDDGAPLKGSILKPDDVELYLKTDNDNKVPNYAAHFRSSGMRIWTRPTPHYQRFSAVIVIRGKELSTLLRKAEPVQHDKWNPALIKDKAEAKKAKEALANLKKWFDDELSRKYQTVGAKSQDSGEGDYLPDDVDDSESNQQGNDLLRVRQKMSKSHTKAKSPGNIQAGSRSDKGATEKGGVYGKKKKRKKKKSTVVAGAGEKQGSSQSNAGAPLSAVNIIAQKAFLHQESIGQYKVVLKTAESHQKVYLTFYAIGEDNSEDPLVVQSYTCDDKYKPISGGSVGPLAFEQDKFKEIMVRFENQERMRLNIVASEVK